MSQYTFALCSYHEKKGEPHEMIQLDGYTVDYCEKPSGMSHVLISMSQKGSVQKVIFSDFCAEELIQKVIFSDFRVSSIHHYSSLSKCLRPKQSSPLEINVLFLTIFRGR